jgi:4-hydroxy-tetrahydrodipicolinate synthase
MFSGSIVALVTPFCADLSVDWDALYNLVEWHVSAGSKALVINGTTGEAATLTEEEKNALLAKVIAQVAGRIPVIAGTGSSSTTATIAQSLRAAELGADACLIVTPYYNRPTQEGLYQHYTAIAQAVTLPIILYNVPKRTGCDLLPETVARLAAIENIIGLKDATGDLDRVRAQQALTPGRFLLFSGDDLTALEFMALGGHGVISVVANIAPSTMSVLCYNAITKNLELANKLNAQLVDVCIALQAEPNPIAIKWLLAQSGRINDILRLPLTSLSQPFHSLLAPWLEKINLMEAHNGANLIAHKDDCYV